MLLEMFCVFTSFLKSLQRSLVFLKTISWLIVLTQSKTEIKQLFAGNKSHFRLLLCQNDINIIQVDFRNRWHRIDTHSNTMCLLTFSEN